MLKHPNFERTRMHIHAMKYDFSAGENACWRRANGERKMEIKMRIIVIGNLTCVQIETARKMKDGKMHRARYESEHTHSVRFLVSIFCFG